MSFPRYPKYKRSGVEWLGEVPEHWEATRLKNLFELMKRTPVEGDEIVTAFRDGQVTLRLNRRVDGFTNAIQEHGYQRVLPNDLVIHAMDAFAGAIGVSDSAGKSTPVYSVCRPRHEDTVVHYFGRLLRHVALSGYINSLAKGIRERSTEFRWNEAGNLIVPIPTYREQHAIASFLDRETAKIDALIAEQQRLIELLQEKRQAVISHAVTKGLNPDAPMKDSGIEWLGEVPAHWEVERLKFLCDVQTGEKDTENAVEGGEFPFFVRSQTVERIDSMAFDCEAVLTAGDGVGVGKVFHYHVGPFNFHQRVYMMNNFRQITGRFLFHYLRENFYKVALEGAAKSTVDSLRRPMFMNFPVTVPAAAEQHAIIDEIERKSEQYGNLILAANEAIALLQERRSALISAAVTGQIDVRGLAPKEAA
jgi:type I restriction enzyme S subunit